MSGNQIHDRAPPQRAASRRFTKSIIQEGGGAEVEPGEGTEGQVHVGPMRQRRREVTLAGQAPTRAEQTRQAPTRAEQTRQAPTRAEQTRQASTRAEQTRQAPTRAEQMRQAPTRAKQTRQAPSKAEQRPTAETGT